MISLRSAAWISGVVEGTLRDAANNDVVATTITDANLQVVAKAARSLRYSERCTDFGSLLAIARPPRLATPATLVRVI
jgi:hypothetical protein